MTVLGIETATTSCGVGLWNETGLVAETRNLSGNAHAEQLPVCVHNLLAQTRTSATRLEGIAVSIGPGSYTGLRIGLAFAKGMAFALEIKMAAVPTMDGLVSAVPAVSPYACVLMHSKKGEVYRGLYRLEIDQWKRAGDFTVAESSRLGEGLPVEETLFLGEGARLYRPLLERQCGNPRFLPDIYSFPSGAGVASEGFRRLAAGDSDDPDTLVPMYLKPFQGVY
jgi:tRNA threonylcarbamoyladenosine biosynthesis protein TsaB